MIIHLAVGGRTKDESFSDKTNLLLFQIARSHSSTQTLDQDSKKRLLFVYTGTHKISFKVVLEQSISVAYHGK